MADEKQLDDFVFGDTATAVVEPPATTTTDTATETTTDTETTTTKKTTPKETPAEEETKETTASTKTTTKETETKETPEATTETTTTETPATETPATETTELTEDQKVNDEALNKLIEEKITETGKSKEEVVKMLEEETTSKASSESIEIGKLYDELHEELGWEVPEDKMPEKTTLGLINHLKNIAAANSTPRYASEITQAFDDHVKKGGDPKKFISTMFGNPDYENLKIETESQQKFVVAQYLKHTNPLLDEQKISEKVEKMVENEAIEGEATDALELLKKVDAEAKASLAKESDLLEKTQQRQYKEYVDGVVRKVNSLDKIAEFDLSDNVKERFIKYLFDLDDSGQSAHSKKLADPWYNIELAFLSFKGANASTLEKEATTKVTKGMREALSRISTSTPGKSTVVQPTSIGKPTVAYEDFVLKPEKLN